MTSRTAPAPCYFYILRFDGGSYYTGITNNIHRRLKEHQAGQCKSTKHAPLLLSCLAALCSSRSMARGFEVIIKHRGASRWLSMNSRKLDVVYTLPASNPPAIHTRKTGNTHE